MNRHIEQIYYINLDKRTDRNEHIVNNVLPWLKADKNIIQRISAVDATHHPTNVLRTAGCTLSHLKVFEDVLKNNYKYFMVLEDDFTPIISSSEFEKRINKLFIDFLDFDACQLAYGVTGQREKINDIFYNSRPAFTTSGYIMNIDCCRKIKPIWENSVEKLFQGGDRRVHAIDRAWQKLKEFDRWLLTKCGKQLEGFSDIEDKIVNYRC